MWIVPLSEYPSEYSPSAVKSSVFKHLASSVSPTFFMSIHFRRINFWRKPIPFDSCKLRNSSCICKTKNITNNLGCSCMHAQKLGPQAWMSTNLGCSVRPVQKVVCSGAHVQKLTLLSSGMPVQNSGKIFSRLYIEIFSLFFPENRI